MDVVNQQEHERKLAIELLDDIELSRTTVSQQVLKSTRLARLVGDNETSEWLQFEMSGVPDSERGRAHMWTTSRWTDEPNDKGWWGPVSDYEVQIAVLREQLEASRIESFSGSALIPVTRDHRIGQTQLSSRISEYSRIVNRVRSLLHDFARRTYYEMAFSSRQLELFDHARNEVDGLLAPLGGKSLEKIESIYARLSEGDDEAISQALNTCRRLIDSFADAVYPPVDQPVTDADGKEIGVGADKTKNRINLFAAQHIASKSRRDRLRRTLSDIYARLSAGVHSDVTSVEARYLFLNTYTLLGEILSAERHTSIAANNRD